MGQSWDFPAGGAAVIIPIWQMEKKRRLEKGSDLFKVTPANERESPKEDPVQKT